MKKTRYYIIKRVVEETFQIVASSKKEALELPLEDPSMVRVIRETAMLSKVENSTTHNNNKS